MHVQASCVAQGCSWCVRMLAQACSPCTHRVCKPTGKHTHALCVHALAHALVHAQVRTGGARLHVQASCVAQGCSWCTCMLARGCARTQVPLVAFARGVQCNCKHGCAAQVCKALHACAALGVQSLARSCTCCAPQHSHVCAPRARAAVHKSRLHLHTLLVQGLARAPGARL